MITSKKMGIYLGGHGDRWWSFVACWRGPWVTFGDRWGQLGPVRIVESLEDPRRALTFFKGHKARRSSKSKIWSARTATIRKRAWFALTMCLLVLFTLRAQWDGSDTDGHDRRLCKLGISRFPKLDLSLDIVIRDVIITHAHIHIYFYIYLLMAYIYIYIYTHTYLFSYIHVYLYV